MPRKSISDDKSSRRVEIEMGRNRERERKKTMFVGMIFVYIVWL